MIRNMLLLGGTGFIGSAFCRQVRSQSPYRLTLLNRGLSAPEAFADLEQLQADRNDAAACAAALAGRHWDYVVDFCGYEHAHIENVVCHCRFEHYTFMSTSAVELSWPADELFAMAQHKLWCEHLLAGATEHLLILRPGFVVGKEDPSQRFEPSGAHWVWKGTQDPVQPVVHVDLLVSLMLELISRNHCGVVRAGYQRPRLEQASQAMN